MGTVASGFSTFLDEKRRRRSHQTKLSYMEKIAILDKMRERDNDLRKIRKSGS